MDLKITDLTQEQYNKIMDFSKTVVEKKYSIVVCVDGWVDTEFEKQNCFEVEGIEDFKIKNNLRDYFLWEGHETDFSNEEAQEMQKEGYHLFYIEGYSHSGICLYEFGGSLRDRWDCGIAGVVAIKCKDWKIAHQAFLDFIEVWNKINNGEFYGFKVFDNFGEEIDSCWGFWDTESMWDSVPDCITKEQFDKACDNIQY